MKPIARVLFAALGLLVLSTPALAQEEGEGNFTFNYLIGFPTSSTGDFVDHSVSFRGLGFEWFSNPREGAKLSWGFAIRWQYYRNVQDSATFNYQGTDITGRLYRAVDAIPLTLQLRYEVPQTSGKMFPYVGLGAGAIYGLRELAIGAITTKEIGWQFVLTPEIGARFKFQPKGGALNLGLRYDGGFGTDSLKATTHLTVALGWTAGF